MKNSKIFEKAADYCATFVLRYLVVLWLLFIVTAVFSTPVALGKAGSFPYIKNFLVLPILAFIIAGYDFFLQLSLIVSKVPRHISHFIILPVFFLAVSFLSIFFASQYFKFFLLRGAQEFDFLSFLAPFIFASFITFLYYPALGADSFKIRVSDLLYDTAEKERCMWQGDAISEDYLPVKYKKKKKQIITLKEILREAKAVFIKCIWMAILLFIAAGELVSGINTEFFLACRVFFAIAFIAASLSHTAEIMTAKLQSYSCGANVFGSICCRILSEYFVFAVCAYSLYFAGEFIQGFYVKDLAAAYTGGFVFYVLRILFLFCVYVIKAKQGKQ